MGFVNSFAPLESNSFSRKWGGGGDGSAVDPYVSGYFFTHWAYLPPKLGENIATPRGPDGLTDEKEARRVMRAACLGVTLPGGTVNKAEFTGLGGVKWSVPTNVEFDNTVTIKFLEFSTLPIMAIISGWVRMIRDYRSGTTSLVGDEGEYTKSNYAGTLYYYTTKPDGKLVEYYACLTGMFPLKDPMDQYGGDITTYDKLELDIDFNVDYVWREEWVRQRCQSISDSVYMERNVDIHGYGEEEPSS